MTLNRLFALGVLFAVSAGAETFSFGVIGGAPFTDVVNSVTQNNVSYVANSTNFTVGPTFQVTLPLSLRFEVDALYRPYSFLTQFVGPTTILTGPNVSVMSTVTPTTASASEWRFPFLLQYRFHTPIVKPFLEVGVSFDHLAAISQAAQNFGPINQSNAGVVVGGGVDVKIPFVRLSGELRYTHQGSAYFEGLSNVNQAEVLFGLHF
jgi:hypothetical protein